MDKARGKMLETVTCLAIAIYFEARGEPEVGQIAVGNVILNRTKDPRFPNDVCSVITQGPTYKWSQQYPIKNKCQFSFYCDGKSDEPKNDESFRKAVYIARELVTGKQDYSGGALFYHAVYVYPEWASKMKQTVRINKHIFYRER